MKAVHFGAGSIGRGFIGDLLFESGYHTTFVDVNDHIIEQINKTNSYDLFVIEDNYRKKTITNVQALSSSLEEERVIIEILNADIITTSVWVNNLPKIAPVILKGLKARKQKTKSKINILACENAMFNSELLKKYILECDEALTLEDLDSITCFPNTAVDRMVLEDKVGESNVINIGKEFELVIERNKLVDQDVLPIKNADYTVNLKQYIEKKLYIINGGHAWAGYIGFLYGYDIIQDVFHNDEIVKEVRETMIECARLLTSKYDFDLQDLIGYVDFAISRFQTPGIKDTINRVCRSPIRKLNRDDRLVGPTIQCEDYGTSNQQLLKGIAAVFLFVNQEDDQANELQDYVQDNGIEKAITKFTGISNNSPLFSKILENYKMLLEVKNSHRKV